MDKRWDIATQVQKRVQLDRRLRGAEQGPRKDGQAKVDGGGVERVDGVVDFQPEILAGVQRAREANQRLREVRVNPQSRFEFALASVLRDMPPRMPI